MNTVTTRSTNAESKAPTLALRGEKPAVPTAPKVWVSASNQSRPASSSNPNKAAVSAR